MNSKIKLRTLVLSVIGFLFILFFATSCTKSNDLKTNTEASSIQKNSLVQAATTIPLSSYKSSTHELSVGFYRTYGTHYGSITAMPDSVDIVVLFGGWGSGTHNFGDSLSGFITALHANGIKVEYTGNLDLIAGAGENASGYAATAAAIMDTINKYGFDGFDIDVETTPSGSQLTDMTGVYTALSQTLGPKSGTSKLLTFDTNQPGSNSLFQNVHSMVSYVYFQDYGNGTNGLQNTWSTFSSFITSAQFIPGFSFYEENGYPSNVWYDVNYPINGEGTGNAYNLAHWEPTGGAKKGGVFGYAIDRDAPLTSATDNTIYVPNYIVTRQLIQIMNPAGGGTSGTGTTFNPSSYYNIINHTSGLVLDGEGATTSGSAVDQLSNVASTNVEWQLIQLTDGYYTIKNVRSGLVLDGKGLTTSGSPVGQWSNVTSTNLEWQIIPLSDGYYTLENHTSGLVLDGKGLTTSGSPVDQWSNVTSTNLEWQISVVSQ